MKKHPNLFTLLFLLIFPCSLLPAQESVEPGKEVAPAKKEFSKRVYIFTNPLSPFLYRSYYIGADFLLSNHYSLGVSFARKSLIVNDTILDNSHALQYTIRNAFYPWHLNLLHIMILTNISYGHQKGTYLGATAISDYLDYQLLLGYLGMLKSGFSFHLGVGGGYSQTLRYSSTPGPGGVTLNIADLDRLYLAIDVGFGWSF